MMADLLVPRNALDAEREISRCLAEKEPTFAEISHFLLKLVSIVLLCALALWSNIRTCAGFVMLARTPFSSISIPPATQMPRAACGMHT